MTVCQGHANHIQSLYHVLALDLSCGGTTLRAWRVKLSAMKSRKHRSSCNLPRLSERSEGGAEVPLCWLNCTSSIRRRSLQFSSKHFIAQIKSTKPQILCSSSFSFHTMVLLVIMGLIANKLAINGNFRRLIVWNSHPSSPHVSPLSLQNSAVSLRPFLKASL